MAIVASTSDFVIPSGTEFSGWVDPPPPLVEEYVRDVRASRSAPESNDAGTSSFPIVYPRTCRHLSTSPAQRSSLQERSAAVVGALVEDPPEAPAVAVDALLPPHPAMNTAIDPESTHMRRPRPIIPRSRFRAIGVGPRVPHHGPTALGLILVIWAPIERTRCDDQSPVRPRMAHLERGSCLFDDHVVAIAIAIAGGQPSAFWKKSPSVVDGFAEQ